MLTILTLSKIQIFLHLLELQSHFVKTQLQFTFNLDLNIIDKSNL